jgi:hypothetical protein
MVTEVRIKQFSRICPCVQWLEERNLIRYADGAKTRVVRTPKMLQSKGKQFQKNAESFKIHMVTDEAVLASVQIGIGNYILTNIRFVGLTFSGGIKFSYPLSDISSIRTESGKTGKIFFLSLKEKSEEKLGVMIEPLGSEFEELFSNAIENSLVPTDLRVESKDAAAERYASVPTNRKKSNLPSHLVKAIQRNAKTGEDPLMIITGEVDSTDGSLIVFEDRCVISKSGVIGGLMSGSLGGAREATFYFKDITGIEYNSGLMTGVLEILTPSYESSPNKDFWTGVLNANKNFSPNDPRASSNTLPLMKSDYLNAKPLIDRLRTMIQAAKDSKVVVNIDSPNPALSTADEIAKLANLLERGLITEDEFISAKVRLISG